MVGEPNGPPTTQVFNNPIESTHMHLQASLDRLTAVYSQGNAFALTNWLVKDLAVAVARDMLHPDMAEEFAKIPDITSAATAKQAQSALSKMIGWIGALASDTHGGASDYMIELQSHLMPVQLELEINQHQHWVDVSAVVNAVKLLCSMAGAKLPAGQSAC